MVCGQADQHGHDPDGVVDLPAQVAGAGVGAADFRHGVPAAGLHGEAVRHLEPELGGRLLGGLRLRLEQREPATREPLRFVVRVQAC